MSNESENNKHTDDGSLDFNWFRDFEIREKKRRNADEENLHLIKDVVDFFKDYPEDERLLLSNEVIYGMLHHKGNSLFKYDRDSYRSDAKALVVLLSDLYKPLGFAGLLAEMYWVLNRSVTTYDVRDHSAKTMARELTSMIGHVTGVLPDEEE
jgi:hypothetical protein